jgi:transposase
VIGHEESEQLDVQPAKYFVLVTRREKRACKRCEERGVMAAPLPPRIIEKSLVSDQVIIDAIISKYSNHCPLFRQSVILLRDAGINISRATIDGWVMRVGDLLMPLVAVMGRELVGGSYIQADETPVDVQTRDGRSRNHQAYLWQYGSPGGAVVFEFRMGRGREGPVRFLEKFNGILQTDAYAAYDRVGGPKLVHAACWAHARRRFVEAVKLNPQDVVSARVVALMAKLFAIDAQAREQNMNHATRHALRIEQAPMVLAELHAQIEAASRTALPSSPLGKACSYTLRLWDKLTRFLDYPELELSNNLAENSMRPVAIGRRNWTHLGHEKAGPRVAAILSVVETCRRLKIPVREYLADVLPGLANTSIQRLPELTPTAWAANQR